MDLIQNKQNNENTVNEAYITGMSSHYTEQTTVLVRLQY